MTWSKGSLTRHAVSSSLSSVATAIGQPPGGSTPLLGPYPCCGSPANRVGRGWLSRVWHGHLVAARPCHVTSPRTRPYHSRHHQRQWRRCEAEERAHLRLRE